MAANFTGTTAVTFNGTGASFTFVNDGQITAVVPTTASYYGSDQRHERRRHHSDFLELHGLNPDQEDDL